jgi:4-aminobutyrate aminotransferase-like enzyme
MERENLFEQSTKMGSLLVDELKDKLSHHPNVGDIRGKGLMVGIELVSDRTTKEPLPVEQVNQVIAKCKEKRLIIGKNGVTVAGFNNVLTLSPPLNITLEEKDFILTGLVESLETL